MNNLNDRYLTPETVMINRFKSFPKPRWKAAILCFRDYIGCEIISNFLKATPIKGYKVFYGIDSNETESQVFETEVSGQKIGIITRLSWGGPQAAILVEELAQLGVEYIIGYGAAGSIDREIRKGDLVVGINSLVTDGTSRIYFPNNNEINCNGILLNITRVASRSLELNVKEVTVANVDALYRETRELVSRFQSEGAQIVNLETSALYASAEICKVNSIWLGFISDSLVSDKWDSWDTDSRELSFNLSKICLKIIGNLFEKR
ncbi:phosphorylase family protein [Paenibacillus alkalitolerans]|uniref:phosphorylase family protein n=1 Tax=Paenibacillus alkalitolerans TaxID=2799335 RepID=UPI0018F6BA6E|nr:hypothetical protein [Paenibacillus alkalitolerans]